jgi:hypothetical protein
MINPKISRRILIALFLAALTISGIAAYTFWTSTTFTTTITVAATLPVYINIVDPTPLPTYGNLETTTDFLPGNLLRLAVDEAGNNVQDDLYLTMIATGEYISAGGTVGATIQRKTINTLDTITNLGTTITIPNVNAATPTLLEDIAELGTPGTAYVEITVTPNPGPSYGDYTLNIALALTDNT